MKSTSPKVSVVMSTFREPLEYVKQAVESILSQSFRDFEFLIAVDDPNNQEMIDLINEYSKKDSRIKVHVNPQNLGPAESRNRLIKNAKGDYIAIMDADDISLPERLEEQFNFMKKDDELVLIGTLAYKMDDKGEIFGRFNLPTNVECIKIYLKEGLMPFCHPTWFVKKKLYEELGYYNDIIVEDFDFALRAFYKGVKMSNIPEFLLAYRIHCGESRISYSKRFLQAKVADFIGKKYRDGDYLSKETIEEFLNSLESRVLERKIFNFGEKNFVKAMNLKSKGNYLGASLFLLTSFLSPYHLNLFFKILFVKIRCKIHTRKFF